MLHIEDRVVYCVEVVGNRSVVGMNYFEVVWEGKLGKRKWNVKYIGAQFELKWCSLYSGAISVAFGLNVFLMTGTVFQKTFSSTRSCGSARGRHFLYQRGKLLK